MRLVRILGIVLLACVSGCRGPLKVHTSSRICSDELPIRVSAQNIPIDMGGEPVKVQTATPLRNTSELTEMVVRQGALSAAKIALIDVDGILLNKHAKGLLSAGDNPVSAFREKLDAIEVSGDYCGVVLRINSPGGGVTATDIMRRELQQFKQRSGLPVIACLMDVGAGGAYYLATEADHIISHPTSVIGGLGVVLNLYQLEDNLNLMGVVDVAITAGKYANLGSPTRMMSDDGRRILQQIAQHFHQRLRSDVVGARPNVSNEEETFDGRIMTADQAFQAGLVDSIGYLDEAIDYCEQLAQVQQSAVVMLHRPEDPARTPYDVTPNEAQALLPHLVGLNRSDLPTFLYVWFADPAMETSLGN